ncbi:hypothetical protein BGZ60DRAFT_438490 [Tricladium varicosporioides]|nr:hypothetical protein BGZ60DRAFT_438490 [Hymenoscyphus varicosporioides]
MSYKDLEEARVKRIEKEAAKEAKGKNKRSRKRKRATPEIYMSEPEADVPELITKFCCSSRTVKERSAKEKIYRRKSAKAKSAKEKSAKKKLVEREGQQKEKGSRKRVSNYRPLLAPVHNFKENGIFW